MGAFLISALEFSPYSPDACPCVMAEFLVFCFLSRPLPHAIDPPGLGILEIGQYRRVGVTGCDVLGRVAWLEENRQVIHIMVELAFNCLGSARVEALFLQRQVISS
jgi:hypothetical protein